MSAAPGAVLVACVGKKVRWRTEARSLYQSAWFLKCRDYCERRGMRWYIVSAHYGLLRPERVVEPYDVFLADLSLAARQAWGAEVLAAFRRAEPLPVAVELLLGGLYRAALEEPLRAAGYTVSAPLAGKRIGFQLQWLDQQRAKATYGDHRLV